MSEQVQPIGLPAIFEGPSSNQIDQLAKALSAAQADMEVAFVNHNPKTTKRPHEHPRVTSQSVEWTTFSVRSNPQNHCLAVIGDVDRATAPHNEANARLIAAAPDLLEACQSIWKMIEDGTLVRDVSKDSNPDWSKMLLEFTMTLNKVNATIAKATGGQSYPL